MNTATLLQRRHFVKFVNGTWLWSSNGVVRGDGVLLFVKWHQSLCWSQWAHNNGERIINTIINFPCLLFVQLEQQYSSRVLECYVREVTWSAIHLEAKKENYGQGNVTFVASSSIPYVGPYSCVFFSFPYVRMSGRLLWLKSLFYFRIKRHHNGQERFSCR